MKWKPGEGNLKGGKPGRESCKDPGPGKREIFGDRRPGKTICKAWAQRVVLGAGWGGVLERGPCGGRGQKERAGKEPSGMGGSEAYLGRSCGIEKNRGSTG